MTEKLTSRQVLAINQIITSPTIEEARRRARISKGTLYAWLKDETFKLELKRQRDEIVGESLNRLKCAMGRAIDGLIDLMASPRPDLRRWVYKDIIDYAFRCIEMEEIESRLESIENYLGSKSGFQKKSKAN